MSIGTLSPRPVTLLQHSRSRPAPGRAPTTRRGIWLENPGTLTRYRWPVGAGALEQSPVGHHDDEGDDAWSY